jgi:hypothetical protein
VIESVIILPPAMHDTALAVYAIEDIVIHDLEVGAE